MIKIIKLGNLIYENIEAKTIDENGNEIWNIPNDINILKEAFKDTTDWYTNQYINNKLQEINEDLQDIATEQSWLEGVFYSIGLDPSKVKAEITKVVLGQEDIDTAITNLAIPNEYIDDFKRAIEIAKIIAWKEQIWKKEAEIENTINNMKSIDELINFDVKQQCENEYSKINLG